MTKKGFTLIELLAVIVILAIVIAIAVPAISNLLSNVSKNSFKSSAKLVLKGIEYKLLVDRTFDPSSINETNVKALLDIDDSNYQTLTVKEMNNTLYVTIVGKNKWNKLTVSGTKSKTSVNDTVTTLSYGANKPLLVSGMVPIKWDGTSWVDTIESDTDWYNYTTTDKKWANVRTEDGSMWVWIPRYIYKISSGWHTSTVGTIDIQFSKGVDDNWNKAVIGGVNFDESAESSNNTWTNHPAFTFGSTELTGIWVSKFEASSTNPAATYGGGDVTNLKVKSIPNVASWRNISINSIYTVIRSMETDSTYGWGTSGNGLDTHLMKNTEWGVVAYLTQSVYGKNAEVWLNNSSTFYTGCAGTSVSAASYAGCENTYETTNGVQTSTTGNIYGVYDMSGGAWDYVASYLNNNSSNLSNGSNVTNADNKYKNIYEVGTTDTTNDNYVLTINGKGDSIYETSAAGSSTASWNGDNTSMLKTDGAWIMRGGNNAITTTAGIFAFGNGMGGVYGSVSFRPVIAVGVGL